MYSPPNEKVGFQVKVTFCFWLMYPPGMKKLDTGQSDILVLADVPPLGMKKLDTGQSDILVLADVPP